MSLAQYIHYTNMLIRENDNINNAVEILYNIIIKITKSKQQTNHENNNIR